MHACIQRHMLISHVKGLPRDWILNHSKYGIPIILLTFFRLQDENQIQPVLRSYACTFLDVIKFVSIIRSASDRSKEWCILQAFASIWFDVLYYSSSRQDSCPNIANSQKYYMASDEAGIKEIIRILTNRLSICAFFRKSTLKDSQLSLLHCLLLDIA